MPGLPAGTVTFLFADLEGSTRLLERVGDRFPLLLENYRRILRTTTAAYHGHEVDAQGDAFFAAFARATEAVSAATEIQRALAAASWPDDVPVRARIGLHTGEPLITEAGYTGTSVHRAARICHAGHGGQILVSQTTKDLTTQDLPGDVHLKDLGLFTLKDLSEPQHLYQVLTSYLPSEFPPLRTPEAHRHNLPRALTTFVGREHEIAEIRRLLLTVPLLTLTGAGGSGKTRLAIEAAAGIVDRFEDGLWLVELDSLSSPDLVPQAVATELGIREEPQRALTETLAQALRSQSLLVLLDNCEHLLESCARLIRALLQAAPRLRILATSREPLRTEGEIVWPVPTLSVPAADETRTASHLLRYDSVRLFVDRAGAARTTFTFNDADAAAIGEICRRLDGIPLAIELAAARVPVLTVEQIAARLSDRFRLLAVHSHSTLPRHQTLRSVMDWSYELLPSSERLLLQRVSVFAGGWTIDAAEAICAGGPLAAADILDQLQQLVSKSLVAVQHPPRAEARYWLLESVRQYASEKLRRSDEADAVRRQHQDWFMRFGEQMEPNLRGPNQVTALERLDVELDNLRAMMEWSLGADGNSVSGLRTAVAMGLFWVVRAHLREGRQWIETLLAAASGAPPLLRARALAWIGVLAWWLGDVAAIRGPSEEALALGRAHAYRWESALALHQLAHVVATEGDPTTATPMMEKSVALFRDDGDQWGVAYSLACLGDLARIQGRLDQARPLLEEAVAIMRRNKNSWGLGVGLHNLGHVLLRQSPDRAEALFAEAIVHLRATRSTHPMIFCLAGLAGAAAQRGQLQRAARMLGAVEALLQSAQLSWQPVDRAEYDRNLTIVRKGVPQTTFDEAWAAGRAMTLDEAIDYALGVHQI